MPKLFSDEIAVRRYYRKRTGKELNLENPITFSEKLNWYKLNAHLPLMQQCADKVAVRDYVSSLGLAEHLNEHYGIFGSVDEINLDRLPERFVLKASHGSHMNLIVKDKSKVNWFREKLMMGSWLRQNIYWGGREWVYKDMPRQLVAERYLEDDFGELRDFKFFCFNGEPNLMQYDAGRFSGRHYRNFYDMDAKLLPMGDIYCESNPAMVFPMDSSHFTSMQEMARRLSEPFQFVRVDFYLVKGKIYFGEMTFFHMGGISGFLPEENEKKYGDLWILKDGNMQTIGSRGRRAV